MSEYPKKCPTCYSPSPERHPRISVEEGVKFCPDSFHHGKIYRFRTKMGHEVKLQVPVGFTRPVNYISLVSEVSGKLVLFELIGEEDWK